MIQTTVPSLEPLRLQTTPVITMGYVIQVIFSLVLVLGLIYLCSKYLFPRLQVTPKGRSLEVVERIGLEPQVTAYLLKAQDLTHLVVVAHKQVIKLDSYKSNPEGPHERRS